MLTEMIVEAREEAESEIDRPSTDFKSLKQHEACESAQPEIRRPSPDMKSLIVEEKEATGLAIVPVAPVISLQDWADQATHAWRKSVEATVGVGRVLIRAKEERGHGEFGKIFRDHEQPVERPFKLSLHTGEQVMRIARHPTLANSIHWVDLPTSWRTLAELARLKPAAVESDLAKGLIHPEMTRAEAWELALKWQKPPDSSLPDSSFPDSSPMAGLSDAKRLSIHLAKLQRFQDVLRNRATELNVELNAPLTFSEDGRIQSGVLWIPPFTHPVPIKSKATEVIPSCICDKCGKVH
ncbi:MAG TPA: hypothetical protein VN638_10055 [Nitrospiraceae bacterium]|nr:hypothetical protein [Nitrospiraceae bacterium]